MTAETIIEGLSPDHERELMFASDIRINVIRDRYYQTVTADQLPDKFADYQRRDGLVIPIYNVHGEMASFQLKPHNPRISKNGKPIKYETAANAPQVLDVPRRCRKMLGDPKIPLWITEGAKKVDSGLSNGIECIIGLQGVYGWRGTGPDGGKTVLPDWESIALNNREVIIAFDSDVMTKDTVRSALDRLSAFLGSRGAKVRFLHMPDLASGAKCGLDDWFALVRSLEDLQKHIVDPVSTSVASRLPSPAVAEVAVARDHDAIPRIISRSMDQIETKEIDWLWPGWLPKGMLALLGGYAGDGKSTLTAALAAALSIGGSLPDGTKAPVTNSMLVLTEDDVSHVVKGRLEIHGADSSRVRTLDNVELPDGSSRLFNLKTDVPLLRQEVVEQKIGLIVIDPLSGVMGNSDRNSEGEVREILTSLAKMAEETGCTVLGIAHIGKTDGQAKSFQKVMGSTAYTAVARTVWMLSELPADYQTPGDPVKRMLGVAKSNYAVPPMSLQYHRPQDAPIEWLGVSPLSVDEVFSRLKKGSDGEKRDPSETDKAEEWLLEFMDGKRMLASEVEAAAKEEGFKMATMNLAKRRMGLMSLREGQRWYWIPPAGESVGAA